MSHGAPDKFLHGSAITGREHNLIVGYEMEMSEGSIVNKEVTGAAGGSDVTIANGTPRQMRDPIHGPGIVMWDNLATVSYTQVGDTRTAGTICITARPHVLAGTSLIQYRLVGTTYYYIYFSAGANLYTRFGNAAAQDSGYDGTVGKSVRIAVKWENNHVYVFVDGVQVDDYAAVFANDLDTMPFEPNGGNDFNGEMYEYKLYRRALSDEEIVDDYFQYARRSHYLESFRSARVSSAAVNFGPLENTRWTVAAINGTDIRIADALDLERASGFTGAKCIESGGRGYVSIPTQQLGMAAADPEAAYGTIAWWMRKAAGTAPVVAFISSTDDMTNFNGYRLIFNADESVEFNRFTGGVDTNQIFLTLGSAVPVDTWFKVTVVRRYDGQFSVFVNGTLLVPVIGSNPGTDNVHANGSFLLQELDNGDATSLFSHRWGAILP